MLVKVIAVLVQWEETNWILNSMTSADKILVSAKQIQSALQ